jgi:DNA polymerase-3 subunit epsilon
VVYLDTETTGLGLEAEIVDIAVVAADGQVLLNTTVRPNGRIPTEASRVHGIHDADVVNAPSWPIVHNALCRILAGRRTIVYNAEFDRRIVEGCCDRHGLPYPSGKWECAMLAFAQYRGEPNENRGGFRWHKLDVAAAAFGLAPGGHRALGDALACRAVVWGMAGRAPHLTESIATSTAPSFPLQIPSNAGSSSSFSIYSDVSLGRFAILPEYLDKKQASETDFARFIREMTANATVVNGSDHARRYFSESAVNGYDWSDFPSILPQHPTAFVEVDAPDTMLMPDGRIIQRTYLLGLGVGWAALVTVLQRSDRDRAYRIPVEASLILRLWLIVRDDKSIRPRLPFADVLIPLDRQGRAMRLGPGGPDSMYYALVNGSEADRHRVAMNLTAWLHPIVMSLASANGSLPPEATEPKQASWSKRVAFPIREALCAGRLDIAPLYPAVRGLSEAEILAGMQAFITSVSAFDASPQARRYLLEERDTNYEWSTFPPLIPPQDCIYIEVHPPDMVWKEDGRIIPRNQLVGVGVEWAALVSIAPRGSDDKPGPIPADAAHVLNFDLIVRDAEDAPPRYPVARAIVPLDGLGRAMRLTTHQDGTYFSFLFGADEERARDYHNVSLWLQPIVMRLAAFNVRPLTH